MTTEEVFMEKSDRQKILEYLDDLEAEHPYKVWGKSWTYHVYNEAWCDAIDRVRGFVEGL